MLPDQRFGPQLSPTPLAAAAAAGATRLAGGISAARCRALAASPNATGVAGSALGSDGP